jgi:heme exporter protein CcmD
MMGQFAAYVWASYAISLAALTATAVFTVVSWRRAQRNLKTVQDSETNL